MATSRKEADSDSLELLLDTICNIFGGIIFIAMLVSILTSYTSSAIKAAASEQSDRLQQIRATAQAQELQQQVDALRKSIASAEKLQNWEPTLEELKTRAERDQEKRRLTERLEREQKARKEATDSLATVEQTSQTIDQKIQEYEAWLKEYQEKVVEPTKAIAEQLVLKDLKLKQLEFEIKDLKSSRQLQGRLPVEQRTAKSEITVALRWGKMFVFAEGINGPLKRNFAGQVTIREAGLRVFSASLNEPMGIRVPETELPRELQALCSQLRPESTYFHLMVYPDSVRAYRTLRTMLLGAGFQIQLSEVADDGPIVFRMVDHGTVQ